MKKMLRYDIPVDSRPHDFWLGQDPLAADGQPGDVDTLDFWVERDPGAYPVSYKLQVFGTGDDVPYGARWLATTRRQPDGDVWHLYEITQENVLTSQEDPAAAHRDAVLNAVITYPGRLQPVAAVQEELARWIADRTLQEG